jgi:serine/threonine-protein kinase
LQSTSSVHCLRSASAQRVTLKDGRTVTLLETIGSGRLGTVYRGLLESSWRVQRPVAVKILDIPAETDREIAMRRLAWIARRAVCVRHPGIVQIFDVDRTEGIGGAPLAPFVVTELVEGESLDNLVRGARVPVDFALVVVLRAAEALGASLFSDTPDGSLTGLVHGGLHPRQILVSNQGEVKVGDFALGALGPRLAGSIEERAQSLAYAAPEVGAGGVPTPESDVFSLGAILFRLLVGPRFPDDASAKEALAMILRGELRVSFLDPNLPPTLRAVLDRATAAPPIGRYPHARALASDLRREMLRYGLCDAQTCVRHAIVGWSDERDDESGIVARKSGVVPHSRDAKASLVADEPPPSADTDPSCRLTMLRARS